MRRSARILVSVVAALAAAVAGARSASAADAGPIIVVPGRLGIPVIIDGIDVSGAIIEGEFGLGKPHMVAPRIVAWPYWQPPQHVYFEEHYFPATGHEPGYGRYEIEPPPNRQLPPRAPSYHRAWTSQSDPTPASFDPPQPAPPIFVEPRIGRSPRHKKSFSGAPGASITPAPAPTGP